MTKSQKNRLMRPVASIAQLVEQGIENPRVGGSTPPRGTMNFKFWCSSNIKICSSLVQSVERRTVNPYVAGSSPAGGATFNDKPNAYCLCADLAQ